MVEVKEKKEKEEKKELKSLLKMKIFNNGVRGFFIPRFVVIAERYSYY